MNVSIEVKNGILDLLANGVFITSANTPTTLKIKVDYEEISLIIKFLNSDDKVLRKEAKVIDNTTLEILFYNYINPIGNYTTDFWKIGNISGRNLYWSYSIAGLNTTSMKKMEYSFYLGEGVANG